MNVENKVKQNKYKYKENKNPKYLFKMQSVCIWFHRQTEECTLDSRCFHFPISSSKSIK